MNPHTPNSLNDDTRLPDEPHDIDWDDFDDDFDEDFEEETDEEVAELNAAHDGDFLRPLDRSFDKDFAGESDEDEDSEAQAESN